MEIEVDEKVFATGTNFLAIVSYIIIIRLEVVTSIVNLLICDSEVLQYLYSCSLEKVYKGY